MTSIDEQLMAANWRERNFQGADIVDQEEYEGDFRATRIREQMRQRALKKEEAVDKSNTFTSRGTAKVLAWAWPAVIPTLGLSLIYINIHYFMAHMVGSSMFCKFGDEWRGTLLPSSGDIASQFGIKSKTIGFAEKILLVILDLLIGGVVLAVSGLFFMILDLAFKFGAWTFRFIVWITSVIS